MLGDGVFMNFNCVILDVVEVSIGDRTQIGPAVQIYAADHPRDAKTRREGLEFGRPVRIGSDVWIGGGAIILPGVTDGRRRGDRRRQRGHAGCRAAARPLPAIRPGRVNRDRRPWADRRDTAGFAISPLGCYGKHHVCAAHHQH